MLNNPFGVALYLLLRNDLSWSLLSDEEKKIISKANEDHNIGRDDYADPEEYGKLRYEGGENWDHWDRGKQGHRGDAIAEILNVIQPARVLEIGPGAGLLSRLIAESPFVKEFDAVDIGQAFLDYLEPRLHKLKETKDNFSYRLICADFNSVMLPSNSYDAVVLLSTVHHIPDRLALFETVAKMVRPGGVIICYDPTHYLIRVMRLMKKCLFSGYLKASYYKKRTNLSTHHMCSLGEYKKICRKVPQLSIRETVFRVPEKLSRLSHLIPAALLSKEMGIVIEKK